MLSFSLLLLEDFELEDDVRLFSLEEDLGFDFELLPSGGVELLLSFLLLSDLLLLELEEEEEDVFELVGVVGLLLGFSPLLVLLLLALLSSLPGEVLSFLPLLPSLAAPADEAEPPPLLLLPFALFGGSFCWIGSPNKSWNW